MYPVSQDYLQTILGPSRKFSALVQIRNQELTDANISELVLDGTVNPDDTFALGSVAAAKLEVTLLNVTGIIIENAPVEPWLGLQVNGVTELVPLGAFTVDKIDVKNGKTKLTCYDNMLRLERPYFSELSYPNTLRNVGQEIASKAGVTLATTLPEDQVEEISGYTLREAIGFIASYMGGFARFNRLGELEICSYLESGVDIPASSVIDLTAAENPFTIGRLQCRVGNGEEGPEVLSAGSSGNEIYFENPIMTQARLNAILAGLSQLEYVPLTANWQGNPALMPGDKVTISDRNRTYSTIIMEQQLRYTGGLRGTLVAKGKTETAQEFSYSGSMSRKMDRYSVEQANIKLALIDKASIGDLQAANAAIDNLYASKATVVDLTVAVGRIDMLETTRATIEQLNAAEADIAFLYSSKAEIDDLTAATAQIDQLTAGVANINTVLAKEVFAELAEIGQIRAGSSIIAEGAIGSAQVSDLSASKLTAGIADLSLVTIQGAGGRLRIENNLMQVFDGTVTLFERVALGDVNQDGSVYGLRIRGADGNTVLLDENGLTDQGFTDGYNKLPNNSLNPIKLDIGAVVTRINEGTTTIDSSKIYMDNQTLDVAFSSIEDTVSGQGQTISHQGSQIIALADAIQLKVDQQTYVNGMDGVQSQLTTQSGSISVLQNEIVTKVTQTEINNAVNPLDVRITSAESTITQQADQIALRVEKDGVVSAINQSPEQIRISANRVQITGETVFASGYDPSSKATPEDVAAAKTRPNLVSTIPSSWERGTIVGATGELLSSTTRIRTTELYPHPSGPITIQVAEGFEFYVAWHDDSQQYLTGNGWSSGLRTFNRPNIGYFRLFIRYAVDGSIWPDVIGAAAVKVEGGSEPSAWSPYPADNAAVQNYTNWAIDQFGYTLGDMAWADMVELAQLGQTIIQGGFLRTDLIQAGSIAAEKLAVNDLSAISGWFSNLSAGNAGGARLELGQSGGPHLDMFDSGNKLRVSLLQDKLTFHDPLERHGGSIYSFREDPAGYNLPSIAVHSDNFTMIMASPHYVPGALDPSPGKTYAYISLAHLTDEVGVNIGVWDSFGQGNGRILLRPNSVKIEGIMNFPAANGSAGNQQIDFTAGYKLFRDDAGAGANGTRLWLDTPNLGELVLGPRAGANFLHQIRLRSNWVWVEGDLTVGGRMLGTSIVGSDQLRVATGSTSGTINAASSLNIAMHRRTFAQNIYSATHHVYVVGNGNNVADYIARFRLHNTGTVSSAYAIRWEYMASTNPLVTVLLIDTVSGDIVNATMDGGGMEYLVNEYRHSYQEMITDNPNLMLIEPSIEQLAAVLADVPGLELGSAEDITEMLYHNDQVGVDASTLIQHLCYRDGQLQAKSTN